MKKGSLFITGTDTGVGKTIVTGLLGRVLSENGMNTVTQKWVQTGCKGFSEDIAVHLKLMGRSEKDFGGYLEHLSPCVLSFPSSPHLASRLENREVDLKKVMDSYRVLMNDFDFVIVEGAGGPMVPVNDEEMMVDICCKAGMPVLVVTANRLGAINQTILTIEALKLRDITIAGVLFNQINKDEDPFILEDNPLIVNKITGVDVLGSLPYSEDLEVMYDAFRPMGMKVYKWIKRTF